MGGDQEEGDAFDIPELHPNLTSPIKEEEPVAAMKATHDIM
jgi:hypothetical protein